MPENEDDKLIYLKSPEEIIAHLRELKENRIKINAKDMKMNAEVAKCSILEVKEGEKIFTIAHKAPPFIFEDGRQIFIHYIFEDMRTGRKSLSRNIVPGARQNY